MLYEILPDPRALVVAKAQAAVQTLHVHRAIPERVPVGHFGRGGDEGVGEIVDAVVARAVYLEWIQQACAALGDGLEIRFYDHFDDDGFDASVLDHLDQIRCLSIDGVERIRDPAAVGRLPKLTTLRLEPRRVDDAGLLAAAGVHRLTHLTLGGDGTRSIDLAPLADAHALCSLRLLGQAKKPEPIGRLGQLAELAIQPPAKVPLDFINGLVSLQTLKLVLGNLTSMRAIEALPALGDLSFREVHLLEDLGDLQRFPRLRRLQVSDQPRIPELHVGAGNRALEHMYLYSVPALHRLEGLAALPALKSLFAYDSRLDLSWPELPPTLTHFQLMTKRMKGREAHKAEVSARGLTPDIHPDAHFFYK
jgi:hypothetical protein